MAWQISRLKNLCGCLLRSKTRIFVCAMLYVVSSLNPTWCFRLTKKILNYYLFLAIFFLPSFFRAGTLNFFFEKLSLTSVWKSLLVSNLTQKCQWYWKLVTSHEESKNDDQTVRPTHESLLWARYQHQKRSSFVSVLFWNNDFQGTLSYWRGIEKRRAGLAKSLLRLVYLWAKSLECVKKGGKFWTRIIPLKLLLLRKMIF